MRNTTLALVAACLAVAILALLLVPPQLVQADTHTVCLGGSCDFTSIQAAIDAAQPGDTIHVQAGTYGGLLDITKSVTLLGGWNSGFTVRTPRDSTLDPSVMVSTQRDEFPPVAKIHYPPGGNERTQSVQSNFMGSGIEVVIDGFEITGGNVVTDGGGIYVDVKDDSRVIINDNWIHDNHADGQGGGIYASVRNRSALEITNNEVMTNTATQCGGTFAEAVMSTTLTMEGNKFFSNTATVVNGGANIQVRQFGQFSFANNEFVGNEADNFGGLYFGTLNNVHGTFNNNEFRTNRAHSWYGGAGIGIEHNSTVRFDDNLFQGNVAGDSFGGMSIGVQKGCQLVGNNMIIEDNVAEGGEVGGGRLEVLSGSTLSITGGISVTNNEAQGDRGGLHVRLEKHSRFYAPGIYVYNNRALSGSSGGLSIVSESDGHDTAIVPNARVISNTAGWSGGGATIVVQNQAHFDLSGSLFERNVAGFVQGGGLDAQVLDEGSTLLLNHTRFLTNTAAIGGGGAALAAPSAGSYLELVSAEFVSNTADSTGGGIHFFGDGHVMPVPRPGLVISDTLFERNWAVNSSGGGVYHGGCQDGCDQVLAYNRFVRNRAGDDGGGIYFSEPLAADASTGSFSHNRVISNTAGGQGGGANLSEGLATNGGRAAFNHNTIVGNESGDDGGGARLDGAKDGAYAEVKGNTVTDNRVTGYGHGGGLFLNDANDASVLEVRDNTILRNEAHHGGGLRIDSVKDGSTLWMTGNTIDHNVAHGQGGGVQFDGTFGSAFVYITGNSLQHNEADRGGGCHSADDTASDGTELSFKDNLVNHNVAWDDYGGCRFYRIQNGSQATFEDNQFNYNTAGSDDGGIYFDEVDGGSFLWMRENQIIGNRAGISGTQVTGGHYGGLEINAIKNGSEVHLRRNQVLSNTAYLTATTGGNYGALFADLSEDGALLALMDNTIRANQAQRSYAGLTVDVEKYGRLAMIHNVIEANSAITESGGVYITGGGDSQYYVHRNEIIGNSAGSKGGLWIENEDSEDPLWGISENNLIAGNSTQGDGSGVFVEDASFWSINDTIADNGPYAIMLTGTLTATAHLSNTILWGHTWPFTTTHPATQTMKATYSDIEGDWPGAGNIDEDPQFIDPAANDYHLPETSPAVNQVDPTTAPAIDLDGIPRPVPVAGLADMGCYEWFRAGVTLAPDGTGSAKPGLAASYTLTVTNDGNLPDTFLIDVPLNTPVWPVAVNPSSVDLAPGASTTVQVQVSVPPGTEAGTANSTTLRATSQADGAVQDIATVETTADLAPALSLAPDNAAGAFPGGAVIYEHTLSNEANGSDSFQLGAVSSLGWTTLVSPTAVTLGKEGSALVEVYVWVPQGAAPNAVDVTTVTAASDGDPAVSDTATNTTTRKALPTTVYLPAIGTGY